MKTNGGPWVQTHYVGFHGKTTSTYQRDYRIALPAGGALWDIKIVRESDDDPAEWFKDQLFWTSITEVVDGKLASQHRLLRRADRHGAVLRARRRRALRREGPADQDPVELQSVDAEVYRRLERHLHHRLVDNPAWCFYDLLRRIRVTDSASIPRR